MTDSLDPDVSDTGRLTALEAYKVLDTPADPAIDGIVVLARALCAVPVALVSLVAEDRQWFKARSGFVDCGTDLDRSVCKYVLGGSDLLVIRDLRHDARTRANPLVTGEPHIRFYAGAPLLTPDGHALGAICVIDTKPRPEGLTAEQGDCLCVLADLAMAHFELIRKLAAA